MESQNKFTESNRSFLYKLTGRTTLFFFLFLTVLLIFYVSGTYQDFLDSTQSFILFISSATAVFLAFLCAGGTLISLAMLARHRLKRYIAFAAAYILTGSIASVIFIILRTVSILSLGTNLD